MKIIKRIIFAVLFLADAALVMILVLPIICFWWPIVGIRWLIIGGDAMELMIAPFEWIINLPYKIIDDNDL